LLFHRSYGRRKRFYVGELQDQPQKENHDQGPCDEESGVGCKVFPEPTKFFILRRYRPNKEDENLFNLNISRFVLIDFICQLLGVHSIAEKLENQRLLPIDFVVLTLYGIKEIKCRGCSGFIGPTKQF